MPMVARISQGVYRVSAFSSSHRPWSKKLSLSELLQKKVQTKKLTYGTCKDLKIRPEEIGKNIQLLPVSSCPNLWDLRFVENSSTPEVKGIFLSLLTWL